MACPGEQAIVDYVEHRLDEPARAEIDAHVDRCARCLAAVVELASALGAAAPTRAKVYGGRYHVRELLGAGGMGVVYAAHDRELDRMVALKLLRRSYRDGATDGAAPLGSVSPLPDGAAVRRARREARALARLHHPHVVEVFDVGPCDEGVFIAMELVDGPNLRRWLAEATRTWPEILRVFVGAADALAAAHASGLVHRDFKPDNVIVDRGEAKVLDFGLARGHEVDAATPAGGIPDGTLDGHMTQTGTILGTPRYLAPELHAGAPADPRSDQYAFFVALHEALGRRSPFVARSVAELHAEKRRGPSTTGAAWSQVPGWLRRMVDRGTAPQPDARFPSMADVARRLRRDRGHGPWAPIAAAVGALGVAGAWLALGSSGPVGCADPTRSLGDVYSADRRAKILGALATTGPRGEATVAAVDAWAGDFADAYEQACAAEVVQTRDATLGCLAESRAALELVLSRVEAGKDEPLRLSSLPEPAACAQVVADRGGESAPQFQALRESVARGLALANAPAPREALDVLQPAIEQAHERGATWIEARALMAAGVAYGAADDVPAARRTLERAYEVARSHGHDHIQALVATRLATNAAVDDKDAAQAFAWAHHAEAALRRIGRDPALDHELQIALGKTHRVAGDLDAAGESFGRAVESASNPAARATASLNLSTIRFAQSRFDDAQRLQRNVVDLFRRESGDAAPRTLNAKLMLASTLIEADELDEGAAVLSELVDNLEARIEPFPMFEAQVRQAQGVVFSKQAEWPRAVAAFGASLRIAEDVYGVGHVATTPDMLNLARVYLAQPDCDAARRVLARAQTIFETQPGLPDRRARMDALVEQARSCNPPDPSQGRDQ